MHIRKLKKISAELKKASAMHKAQAERIDAIIAESMGKEMSKNGKKSK